MLFVTKEHQGYRHMQSSTEGIWKCVHARFKLTGGQFTNHVVLFITHLLHLYKHKMRVYIPMSVVLTLRLLHVPL